MLGDDSASDPWVWIYNNTGRSVFAVIVFQATANASQFSFPNYGSHYDPLVAGLILAFTAATGVFLWSPQTLARYRFARSRGAEAMRWARARAAPHPPTLVVRERGSRDFAAATTKASVAEQGANSLSYVFSFRRLSSKGEARMSEPMNSYGPMAGRVAVVTGASRRAGIGCALARRLVMFGAYLYLQGWRAHDADWPWGEDSEDAEALTEDLQRETGSRVEYLEADFEDPNAPESVIRGAVDIFGHADILVANHVRASESDIGTLTAE
jgi:hypothetical protein